jgi:DNA-binding PadR family transcriptional regulator
MTKGGALPRTTLQILLALAEQPRHGYGIKLDVEERTGGAISLGSGTLYEAIQRLLGSGWIVEVEPPDDADDPGGPPRRFYSLTPAGRGALREEVESMLEIVDYARRKAILATSRS